MTEKNTKKIQRHCSMILLILDGWGIAAPGDGNAITTAKTKVFSSLQKKYPSTSLLASGKYVGLPVGQPGNSEAGHMNMGAGRIVDQEAVRISKSIQDGSFFSNPVFVEAIRHVKQNNSALHILGMLTQKRSGHADPDHLKALIELARRNKIERVFLHLFTDGRDSSPHVALKLVNALMRDLRGELIATIMGRYYAMDRKKFWKRTEMAYNAMVLGKGNTADSPQAAITSSYNRDETDEFIPPHVLLRDKKNIATIQDNDAIIFFNFRSDRARQLTKAFVQSDFEKSNPKSFKRKKVLKNIVFVAMTDFGPDLEKTITAYPSPQLKNTLPMMLSDVKQLYICESEKYAHMNYFFNGGYADPVNGEVRVKIDSPDVKSYDEIPQMSAQKITDQVLREMKNYDFIAMNFANADMMGHTGNFKAAVSGIEFIDAQIGRLYDAVKKCRGQLIITADHGNAEYMKNPETKEVVTEHTANTVPFILVTDDKNIRLKKSSQPLSCIAPTILQLFGKKIPREMTSKSLLN